MISIKEVKIQNLTHLFETFDNGNLGMYGATYLLEDLCKRYTAVKQRDVSYEIKVIEKLQIPDELKKKEVERIVKESQVGLSESEKKAYANKINVMMDILNMYPSGSEEFSKQEISEIIKQVRLKRSELKEELIEVAYSKTKKQG